MLVDALALVGQVVAVEAAMAHEELLARAFVALVVVLAGPRDAVLAAEVGPLSDLLGPGDDALDHRHLLPEGVDLYHLLYVVPEALVILLHVLTVLGHAVEVELVVVRVPEELLLHLLLHRLLLDLGLQDLLDLVLVGVVLVDLLFIVGAELVGAVVEVVRRYDVSLVVLTHAQAIDG